jgi:hypothetical protein
MNQSRGRITTFYSYKGGTGRSMMLANFAWILATSGKRVLAIDWDLEAPGLHRYFRPFLVDPEMFETDGLIDAFWALAASALTSPPSSTKGDTNGGGPEVAEVLEDATRRLDYEFGKTGYIDFIGAGRQGGTYSERVNSFDWKRFYEFGGAAFLTMAKDYMRRRYDWVLIDSRTGVSDTSGICTIQMPSTVVACFTLNRQSIEGVAAILRSIRAYRSPSVNGAEVGIFPVATRIENAEQERLEAARRYARTELAEFLPTAMKANPREYWDSMEISYRPAYAFEEILSVFGDATGAAGAVDTMISQTVATAQIIAPNDNFRIPDIVDAERQQVLAKYALGTSPGSAEVTLGARPGSATADASADIKFLRGVRAKEQLWRTSGFPWRLLLSRRELDLLTEEDRKAFGRDMAFYHMQSKLMQQFLRSARSVGSITFAIALVIAVAVLILLGIRTDFIDTEGLIIVSALIFLGAWIFLALASSIVVSRDRPYGVRFLQTFMLYLFGPFGPEILDYDPENTPNS